MSEEPALNQGAVRSAGTATEPDTPLEVIIDLREADPARKNAPAGRAAQRVRSFALVALLYAVAIAGAVMTVLMMKSSLWIEVLVADVVGTMVVFAGSFAVKNSSMYDAYWSVAPGVAAVGLAPTGEGLSSRKVLVTVLVSAWAVRLTANWSYGWSGLGHEDRRYVKLQKDTGKVYWLVSFLGIHFFPTARMLWTRGSGRSLVTPTTWVRSCSGWRLPALVSLRRRLNGGGS